MDAVDDFAGREQRVHTFRDGELGFDVVGPLNIPSRQDDLVEQGVLDCGFRLQVGFEGFADALEVEMIVVGEQNCLLGVEAEFE